MKKVFIAALLLLTGLSACGVNEESVLSGIIFERGHGSMWGNQLYLDVRANQINRIQYIVDETMVLESRENIPIVPEQWQALENAVLCLDLKEDKSSWKDILFGSSKLDGGEYTKLTLIWRTGHKEKEINYLWSQSQQSAVLEAILEQLMDTVK